MYSWESCRWTSWHHARLSVLTKGSKAQTMVKTPSTSHLSLIIINKKICLTSIHLLSYQLTNYVKLNLRKGFITGDGVTSDGRGSAQWQQTLLDSAHIFDSPENAQAWQGLGQRWRFDVCKNRWQISLPVSCSVSHQHPVQYTQKKVM